MVWSKCVCILSNEPASRADTTLYASAEASQSTVVAVSPLKVRTLCAKCLKSAYSRFAPKMSGGRDVSSSEIFSPEALVSSCRWREIVRSPT